MRITALAGLSFLTFVVPAAAAEGETDPGQPFCATRDSLVEYVRALAKEDIAWAKSVSGCATLPGGLKLAIIEPVPGSSPIGPLARARVFTASGASAVGYTFYFGHD